MHDVRPVDLRMGCYWVQGRRHAGCNTHPALPPNAHQLPSWHLLACLEFLSGFYQCSHGLWTRCSALHVEALLRACHPQVCAWDPSSPPQILSESCVLSVGLHAEDSMLHDLIKHRNSHIGVYWLRESLIVSDAARDSVSQALSRTS